MTSIKGAALRELLFRVSVLLKGLDGAFEIVGGVALLAVSPSWILSVVAFLTQDELAEDPHDLVANYLLHAAQNFSVGAERFAALYLFSHGVIKIGLVVALLKDRLWAYPVAVIVFGGFIVYQLYRFTLTHAPGLVALSLFDLIVIWLVWIEYRALKGRSAR
jgi:uncharacterized membrane protein